MIAKFFRHLFPIAMVLVAVAQTMVTFGQSQKVKLIGWESKECDNTYDPYLLVTRITEKRIENGVTFLTVNFSDNCCVKFGPQVVFKNNKLFLLPYKEPSGEYCSCDCCFSIEFKIVGLPDHEYKTYFNEKIIEVSNDHYKVFQPSSETHNGSIINRTNRYGFKVGIWMTFYDDGKVKTLESYPENTLYYEPEPLWEKDFYPSGQLSSYTRNDTTELWFGGGELNAQFIRYNIGDTTYRREFKRHHTLHIEKNSLERHYSTIFHSEFDPTYEEKRSILEKIYDEEFFENGQPKFRYGKDTTYTWHHTGRIASLEFNEQKIEYDEEGRVTAREFHWRTKGPAFWGDLRNSLYATIGHNGKVMKIHFVRDEAHNDGIASGVHYNWSWNEIGRLSESPEKWKEQFPWMKFKQLQLP